MNFRNGRLFQTGPIKIGKQACFLLIILLTPFIIYSQEYTNQLQIQHDNDFVFAIDRYYTTGTFISYDRIIDGDFILRRSPEYPIQLRFALGQETYTPRELFESNFDLLERPYAGYLFGSLQISKASENSIFKLEGELGLTGPQSLAGEFQVAYHELINEFIPVWEGEIANSVHANLKSQFVRDFIIPKSDLLSSVSLVSEISVGTKSVYAQQGALAYFGKRAGTGTTSAFGRLGDASELYGIAGVTYKYVVHNALISGHLFGDSSRFTLDEVASILKWDAGLVYRGERNYAEIVYHYQTKETQGEGRWQYVSMTLGRRF